MSKNQTESKPETVAQQETGGDCNPRLVLGSSEPPGATECPHCFVGMVLDDPTARRARAIGQCIYCKGTGILTLRSRVESNDEWLANSQRLYVEVNRVNGQYARQLREATKQSLREIARRMGISAMMLSDLERGNRNWNESMLTKWEAAISSQNAGSDAPGAVGKP